MMAQIAMALAAVVNGPHSDIDLAGFLVGVLDVAVGVRIYAASDAFRTAYQSTPGQV